MAKKKKQKKQIVSKNSQSTADADAEPSGTYEMSQTYDLEALSMNDSAMTGYNFTSSNSRSARSTPSRNPNPKPGSEILHRKRVIFISISQLNASINDIPPAILNESLFCFKVDRKILLPSNRSEKKLAEQHRLSNLNLDELFMQTVKRKDEQGLVLWMPENSSWGDLSDKLIKIEDIYESSHAKSDLPMEHLSLYDDGLSGDSDVKPQLSSSMSDLRVAHQQRVFYKPIKTEVSWWLYEFREHIGCKPRFSAQADSMVSELLACEGKFLPTMELLYQSNPSLVPMRGWDLDEYMSFYQDHEKSVVAKAVPLLELKNRVALAIKDNLDKSDEADDADKQQDTDDSNIVDIPQSDTLRHVELILAN